MSQEQYDRICKERFTSIDKNFDKLFKKFDDLHDKLFEDNSHKCLQSKVNDNSSNIKRVLGVFTFIGGLIITIMGWVVSKL